MATYVKTYILRSERYFFHVLVSFLFLKQVDTKLVQKNVFFSFWVLGEIFKA